MVAPSHDQVGFITLHDEGGLLTSVCRLKLHLFESSDFCFVFEPFYDDIEFYEKHSAKKIIIQGLNLQLKRDAYLRKDYIPAFISERIPHSMRKPEHIPMVMQWLFSCPKHYFGDRYILTSIRYAPFSSNQNLLEKEHSRG